MKIIFSLVTKKEIWVPNRLGWLIIIVGFSIGFILTAIAINPFLSVNAPLKKGFLVIDGSLADQAISQAITFFEQSTYEKMLVTGGPVPVGSYHSKFQNYAEVGKAKLQRMGFTDSLIQQIPVAYALKDRTFHNALTVKNWLKQHDFDQKNITVFEVGPHARRSRLLYELALHHDQIGIVAIEDINYNNQRWWKSSIGFRTVIGESIAYLYVKLFFYP